MDNDFFGDRRKAFEESFFAEQNAKLREQLKSKMENEEKKTALSKVSGISDDTLLSKMIELDIHVDTMVALSIAPLVLVAWADGEMDNRERQAILSAAGEQGLDETQAAFPLLKAWLDQRPNAELFGVWKGFIQELKISMDAEEKALFKDRVIGPARQVAEAAGGFLGMGTISESESKVLEELEAVLD